MGLLYLSSVWDVHNSGASMYPRDKSVCKKKKKTQMDKYYKTFDAHRGSSWI